MKKILKITEWIVSIFLLIVLFLVASPLLPTKEYISTHIVSTGSMEPSISTGSIVFSTMKNDEINRGDIIVFTSPDNPEITIIHRVMNIQGEEYTTKGDNNKLEDSWTVFPSNIKGKVILDIPYIGHAIDWMKTPIGFITLLILPALLFLISQIRRIKEGINDEVERRTKVAIEKNEKKDSTPPVSLLILLLSTFFLLINSTNTYALFSSSAEVTGIVISTGEIENTTQSIIFNEIMWMGSSISEKDEWIELRNLTDNEIDISQWRIYGGVAGYKGHLQIPNGYVIPANGYFLISNKFQDNKDTNLNVEVNLRSSSISLDNNYLENGILLLKDRDGNKIDKTELSDSWAAGINEYTKHSMQRHEDPENGWYTCINPTCGSDIYWKTLGIDFGTPGSSNL